MFRILIVEDIQSTLEELQALFCEEFPGSKIDTAETVAEGIQLIEEAVGYSGPEVFLADSGSAVENQRGLGYGVSDSAEEAQLEAAALGGEPVVFISHAHRHRCVKGVATGLEYLKGRLRRERMSAGHRMGIRMDIRDPSNPTQ